MVRGAFWLKERPLFTRDPRFHAGVYYVQEAGSLFLDHALRHWVTGPVSALDLCAAPGKIYPYAGRFTCRFGACQ